jgi:uncharacterized membrane protein
MNQTTVSKSRAAKTSIFLALASFGIALSTLLIASLATKIALLVVAALLLVATGTSFALAIARPKPSRIS